MSQLSVDGEGGNADSEVNPREEPNIERLYYNLSFLIRFLIVV